MSRNIAQQIEHDSKWKPRVGDVVWWVNDDFEPQSAQVIKTNKTITLLDMEGDTAWMFTDVLFATAEDALRTEERALLKEIEQLIDLREKVQRQLGRT